MGTLHVDYLTSTYSETSLGLNLSNITYSKPDYLLAYLDSKCHRHPRLLSYLVRHLHQHLFAS